MEDIGGDSVGARAPKAPTRANRAYGNHLLMKPAPPVYAWIAK